MEFTRNEKKAILQYVFKGTQAKNIVVNQLLTSKITNTLKINSQSEIKELGNMKDLNQDELFVAFRFGDSFEKIEIFQKLIHEIGL